MNKKRSLETVLLVLLVALAVGTGVIGYHFFYLDEEGVGLGLSDAFYYTLSLFPIGMLGKTNELPLLVQISRILCPLSVSLLAVSLLTRGLSRAWGMLRSIGRGSVAVYGTDELARLTAERNAFIPGDEKVLPLARSHIILMESDEKSLQFLTDNHKRLEKKKVFVGLRQMSSFLMRSVPNVVYFNIPETIARDYWKQARLYEDMKPGQPFHVAILDYHHDGLGYQLLKYGLMNNIFFQDQQIVYDVFAPEEDCGVGFDTLEMMNADQIIWHGKAWEEKPEVIRSADRILLSNALEPEMLNRLLPLCGGQRIDYYTPDKLTYPEKYSYDALYPFGCTGDVLSAEAILRDRMYRDAKQRNFAYAEAFGSEEERKTIAAANEKERERIMESMWEQMDGFLKGSNVASADFQEIRDAIARIRPESQQWLAEAEHLRWCRYHYLNGWRYGIPANGGRKDPKARLHVSLIPWEALAQSERDKDVQQVNPGEALENEGNA